MGTIPVQEYLAHALRLNPEEERLRAEFEAWLPEHIIDCHSHANLHEHVLSIGEKSLKHMLSTFPYFSLEDSARVHHLFHPTKTIQSLRFAKTFRGIDHRAANTYLLEQSPAEDRIALFGLPEDVGYTTSMLSHPRVSALKMYYSYLEPSAQTIYECFPPEILEEAQTQNIPIILHLPKMIVRSIGDLELLTKDFPKLKIVIAHLGLSKLLVPGLEEAYKRAAQSPNIWLDTALNPSPEVVSLALECFGRDRIMFGSDEPLNLLRSVAYKHPEKGERIVTDYKYHWVDPTEYAEYGHLAKDAVHAQWQCTLAIKKAIAGYPLSEQEELKMLIFRRTAEDVFGF